MPEFPYGGPPPLSVNPMGTLPADPMLALLATGAQAVAAHQLSQQLDRCWERASEQSKQYLADRFVRALGDQAQHFVSIFELRERMGGPVLDFVEKHATEEMKRKFAGAVLDAILRTVQGSADYDLRGLLKELGQRAIAQIDPEQLVPLGTELTRKALDGGE